MRLLSLALVAMIAIGLVGCNVSKPYIMKVDRTDQKVEGNRGYLKGTPPPEAPRTNLQRELIAVDIDLPKIEGKPAAQSKLTPATGKLESVNKVFEDDDDKDVK